MKEAVLGIFCGSKQLFRLATPTVRSTVCLSDHRAPFSRVRTPQLRRHRLLAAVAPGLAAFQSILSNDYRTL